MEKTIQSGTELRSRLPEEADGKQKSSRGAGASRKSGATTERREIAKRVSHPALQRTVSQQTLNSGFSSQVKSECRSSEVLSMVVSKQNSATKRTSSHSMDLDQEMDSEGKLVKRTKKEEKSEINGSSGTAVIDSAQATRRLTSSFASIAKHEMSNAKSSLQKSVAHASSSLEKVYSSLTTVQSKQQNDDQEKYVHYPVADPSSLPSPYFDTTPARRLRHNRISKQTGKKIKCKSKPTSAMIEVITIQNSSDSDSSESQCSTVQVGDGSGEINFTPSVHGNNTTVIKMELDDNKKPSHIEAEILDKNEGTTCEMEYNNETKTEMDIKSVIEPKETDDDDVSTQCSNDNLEENIGLEVIDSTQNEEENTGLEVVGSTQNETPQEENTDLEVVGSTQNETPQEENTDLEVIGSTPNGTLPEEITSLEVVGSTQNETLQEEITGLEVVGSTPNETPQEEITGLEVIGSTLNETPQKETSVGPVFMPEQTLGNRFESQDAYDTVVTSKSDNETESINLNDKLASQQPFRRCNIC